jgi:hypothetical protein
MPAVGTLADIGRRCPQFRHRSLQTPARGFLTIPTFRLDLAPPWRGFFYGAFPGFARSMMFPPPVIKILDRKKLQEMVCECYSTIRCAIDMGFDGARAVSRRELSSPQVRL